MALSAAMLLRVGLKQGEAADQLERAVDAVLAAGHRTGDLAGSGEAAVGCQRMGELVLAAL